MSLRWTLLLIGLVILLLVFIYSRGTFSSLFAARKEKPELPERREPSLDGEQGGLNEAPDLTPEPPKPEVPEAPKLTADAKVIAIRLVPDVEESFSAEKLILAFREQGLAHGSLGVFHQVKEGLPESAGFCVANLVEPGSFDLSNLKDQHYPGVSLFMIMPLPVDAVEVFDEMLTTARALANDMDGALLDEAGARLSIQRERYLREEVIEYQRMHRPGLNPP